MKPKFFLAPLVALLALCLALAAFLPAAVPVFAEEAPDEKGDDDEGDQDLGDKKVPFADQVNEAIEHGVNWLLAKPEIFDIPEARNSDPAQGAFWGRIVGERLYGGGKGPGYPHPAGTTALALYTLLKCEVSPKHPTIVQGFNWIRMKHRVTKKWDDSDGQNKYDWDWTEAAGSYELSAMLLALTALYDPHKKTEKSRVRKRKGKLKIKNAKDREWMQRMVDELVKRRGMPVTDPDRADRLGWRYNIPNIVRRSAKGDWTPRAKYTGAHGGNQDLSSTQLAALALFSASRFGMNMPPSVWEEIVEFTLLQQEEDGPEVERHVPGYKSGGYAVPKDKARGFCYIKGSTHRSEGKATGSMTACGVANLLMAREFLANHKKARKPFLASKLPKKIDTAIYDGLAWLDDNWSPFWNSNSGYGYHIYYLYAVERAMDLRGKRLLGKRQWYPLGAKEILARKHRVKSVDVPKMKRGTESKPGMYWQTEATHKPYDVLDTCFALLYLKRASWGMIPPSAEVTGD